MAGFIHKTIFHFIMFIKKAVGVGQSWEQKNRDFVTRYSYSLVTITVRKEQVTM